MNKEEILEAFKAWGKTSRFYQNYAIPFFTENEDGKKMMEMLIKRKFKSSSELQMFMQTSIGVK